MAAPIAQKRPEAVVDDVEAVAQVAKEISDIVTGGNTTEPLTDAQRTRIHEKTQQAQYDLYKVDQYFREGGR